MRHSISLLACLVVTLAAGSTEPVPRAGEGVWSLPSPGGMRAHLTWSADLGRAEIRVVDDKRVELTSWTDAHPAGGVISAAPRWLDDDWLLLKSKSGASSAGVLYHSVRSGDRVAVSWVEHKRTYPEPLRLPDYADITFYTWANGVWRRVPCLLLAERPIYPVRFPQDRPFASTAVDSPAFARMLLASVDAYVTRSQEQPGPEALTWVGRGWVQPSPAGDRAAACVIAGRQETASVLVLDLAPGHEQDLVLLPTEIPSEHESTDIAWLGDNRLRLSAILPGTTIPMAQTVTIAE